MSVYSVLLQLKRLTLVAIVMPIIEKLTQWSQDTGRRGKLQHDIQTFLLLRQKVTKLFEIHCNLGFTKMCDELEGMSV